MNASTAIQEVRGSGLFVVPKPVKKAEILHSVREATTGQVVATLPRVWAVAQAEPGQPEDPQLGVHRARVAPMPEMAFYRKYTEALLRRYLRLSTEAGRVPSLLGRELFRGNVTSYRVKSFEDVVIFCYDVERCLAQLSPMERELIKRIAVQQYSQGEAAAALGMSLRCCIQRYREAIDHLTGILLNLRLMEPIKESQKPCQEAAAVSNDVTA